MSSNRTPDDARRGEARISFSPEKRTKGGGGSASRTLADSQRNALSLVCAYFIIPTGPTLLIILPYSTKTDHIEARLLA